MTKSEEMRRVRQRAAMRNSSAPIVIERREIVAQIDNDPDGEHPMLRAAFMAASDYIADNANAAPISLEWVHGPGKFTASYDLEVSD